MGQTIDEKVGARLRRYREDAGMSPSELAHKAQFGLAELLDFESGRLRLGAAAMFQVCRVLDLRPADLLRGVGQDPESGEGLHDPKETFGPPD